MHGSQGRAYPRLRLEDIRQKNGSWKREEVKEEGGRRKKKEEEEELSVQGEGK
jgi:hypothetical protein